MIDMRRKLSAEYRAWLRAVAQSRAEWARALSAASLGEEIWRRLEADL